MNCQKFKSCLQKGVKMEIDKLIFAVAGSFSISKDGTVEIQGVIRYEIPSQVPKMKVQQLYPPGPFSLSLKLPGRVDPRMFTCKLRYDGIFEVVVMKPGYSDTPAQPSYRSEHSMQVNT